MLKQILKQSIILHKRTNIINKLSHRIVNTPIIQNSKHNYSTNSIDEKDEEIKEILKEIREDFRSEDKLKNNKPQLEEQRNSEFADVQETTNLWKRLSSVNFESFDRKNPKIIYDFSEEAERKQQGIVEEKVEDNKLSYIEELNLSRGVNGVFDVKDLVKLLRHQKVKDLTVIKVPPELKYCEHFIIGSFNNHRHLNAATAVIKKTHKSIRYPKDDYIVVEGKGSDWIAIDMENIVLHLMLPDVRQQMDLETLWTVGSEFDELCNRQILKQETTTYFS